MSILTTLSSLFEPPLWEWGALGIGLIVGSFANVLIHRLPRDESVVLPRSRCPRCGVLIRPWDNVPVVSYVLLLGRCRSCRSPISPRYPLVEAANGAMYFALARMLGPTPQALLTMAFATAVLVLSVIDLEHQLLHDAITLPGTALGLAATLIPGWPVTPVRALAACVGGYVALRGMNALYRLVRKTDGFGGGDPKMVAMLGAFLGWEKAVLTVFLASVGGTLVGLALIAARGRTFQHKLPLGTFLGLGALVSVFAGDPLVAWYRGWLGA